MQWVEDRAYRKADRVVSNLPGAVEHMVARGMRRGKFSWIPNGFSRSEAVATSAHFPTEKDTVISRCSMCHMPEPVWEGLYRAPKDVLLDTDADIAEHAREIYLQAGASHAMPPGNVTEVTDEERARIVAWFEGAGK